MAFEQIPTQSNREKRARTFERAIANSKNIDGFGGSTPLEVFQGGETVVRDIIERISPDEYVNLLKGVNGTLRGLKRDEWGFDGGEVNIGGEGDSFATVFFPDTEDKPELLAIALGASKAMSREGRDMNDIALLLSSVVVDTHPFADANGRTGRIIYDLISNGYNSERLHKLLGEDGRSLLPTTIAGHKGYLDYAFFNQRDLWRKYMLRGTDDGLGFAHAGFSDEIPEKTKELLVERARGDNNEFVLALVRVCERHPEIDLVQYIQESDRPREVVIFDRITRSLTPELADELLAEYWVVKKEYIETMIDAFENPDKPEYQIPVAEDTEVSLVDLWREKVA